MTPEERTLESLRLQRGDARALAAEAVAAAPQSAAARLLEATLLACSRDAREYEAAGWAYARLRELPMNEHQRAQTAALTAAIDGDLERACRIYDQILDAHPADGLALWAAQLMAYYLGEPHSMRERASRVAARLSPDAPGYHGALSMHAYALQECGDYGKAEQAALRALELEPRDLRAEHTLLHVYEMLGQPAEGLRWVRDHAMRWNGEEGNEAAGGHHLWWHVALFFVALHRPQRAVAVRDLRLQQDSIAGLIDASALLWRLHLLGFELGTRC
jgi:tetratricopeptide (TPR) repeat protein